MHDNESIRTHNFSCMDDDFIEKMGQFYTSDTAEALYPYIRKIPFIDWLERQYANRFQRGDRYE